MCQQKLTPAEKARLEKMTENLEKARDLLAGKSDPFLAGYRTPEAIKNIDEVINYFREKGNEEKTEAKSDYPNLSGPETS